MAGRTVAGLAAAIGVALAAQLSGARAPADAQAPDTAIRRAIIRQSIADYPGPCPCPYSVDRAGRRCGGRSAHSRPGGYSPKCFPADVTPADIAAWRRR